VSRILILCLLCALFVSAVPARAQQPPLLPEPDVAALAQELSGETAKRNLEYFSRHHRIRAGREIRAVGNFILERLRAYGVEARMEQFPADGKIFYGTQRSRPGWNAEFAELWELRERGGLWVPAERIASWEQMPMSLAQDSESGRATADLVDVGNGTSESDYTGKEVRGKLVLVSAQPGAVAELAVGRFGAAGIVSYAQNQRTAWWGEDENLVRWGHLETFSPVKTFAFMVSLKRARSFQQRLARGERIRLSAEVRAGQAPSSYDIPMAVIPGADPQLRNEEIIYSCHLDHPRPGANDNASGCATILEAARALQKLINEKKIAPPLRTLRFVWPPEIEGTLTLLNARPEIAARLKAAIHLDMVGGGPETKAIFHVTRGPASLPSFVNDVAEAFGRFVNVQSDEFASTGRARYPLVAPEGGKEPLQADFAEFSSGSDHQIYTDSSWGVPAIYMNDWPDRYIHTNFDTPAIIDPTKLKRAAFIAAASGYYLANLRSEQLAGMWRVIESASLRRTALMLERRAALDSAEAANLARFHLWHERALAESMARFAPIPAGVRSAYDAHLVTLERIAGTPGRAPQASGDGRLVFRRNPEIKGTMGAFGYDYFDDKYGADRAAKLALLRHSGLRGSGGAYAYEVLNLADGRRTAQQIRDMVSAIYGPVPLAHVVEYLRALESIRVVEEAK